MRNFLHLSFTFYTIPGFTSSIFNTLAFALCITAFYLQSSTAYYLGTLLSIMFAFLRQYEKIFSTRHFVAHEYQYFGFLLGFLSSGEVLGEIFDYGQYIIHPETLCRTERYTDTILALTAYIHCHSEQMPLPPNIACETLPSITLVSIENSSVYIPSYILYEDTYCTCLPHPYKVAPFAGFLPYRIN